MSESKGNEAAFPNEVPNHKSPYGEVIVHHGLTKREWFAGMALQGLLANPYIVESMFQVKGEAVGVAKEIREQAVAAADALLAELEKKG